MSDSVNLVTSDEPPISLSVSSSLLTSTCRVFADILSLPSDGTPSSSNTSDAPPPLDLHEPAVIVQAFLDVLAGNRLHEEQLAEETMEGVARLSDKWDAPVVRRVLEGRIWELQALDARPLHAYTLATYLDNPELLERTAARAMHWRASRAECWLDCLKFASDFQIPGAAHACALIANEDITQCTQDAYCRRQCGLALACTLLPPIKNLPLTATRLPIDKGTLREDLQRDNVCKAHQEVAVKHMEFVQLRWAKAPKFLQGL
ncbi:hypothetical protein JCM6882_008234 [Rhodosporidiobolus microsporus]